MMPRKDQPPKPSSLGESKVREVALRRPFALAGFGPGPRPDLWGKAKEATTAKKDSASSRSEMHEDGYDNPTSPRRLSPTPEPVPKRPRFQ